MSDANFEEEVSTLSTSRCRPAARRMSYTAVGLSKLFSSAAEQQWSAVLSSGASDKGQIKHSIAVLLGCGWCRRCRHLRSCAGCRWQTAPSCA